MRRCAFVLLLLVMAALPFGCSGDGVAYTGREYREIGRRTNEMDQKMLIDDLHYLNLDEQPSHLSRWSIE